MSPRGTLSKLLNSKILEVLYKDLAVKKRDEKPISSRFLCSHANQIVNCAARYHVEHNLTENSTGNLSQCPTVIASLYCRTKTVE